MPQPLTLCSEPPSLVPGLALSVQLTRLPPHFMHAGPNLGHLSLFLCTPCPSSSPELPFSAWLCSPLAPPRPGLPTLFFPSSSLRGSSWQGLWAESLRQGHLPSPDVVAAGPPGQRCGVGGWLPSPCVAALSSGIYILSDLTTATVCYSFTALKMFSNNPQVFLLHTIAWLVTAQLNPYLRRLIKTLNRTSHKACSLPASCPK